MRISPNQSQLALAAILYLALGACSSDNPSNEPEIPSGADGYDIVINGGRVIDPETGLDAIRSVGIRDGRIVEISEEPLTGARAIDAADLVVSPGFIDLHSHGQTPESDIYKVHDGVTTALDLELGRPNIAEWLRLRGDAAILNYGASASHQYARTRAASTAFRQLPLNQPLDTAQVEAMQQILADELRAGAIGVGIGIAYVPGASSAEVLAVMQSANASSVPVFAHVRNSDLASIEEAIDLAREADAALHIMHVNSIALGDIEAALAMIDAARQSGLDVTTELYPYTAGSTFIETAIFDEGWQQRFNVTYSDLQWQDTGERLTAETFARYREQGGAVIIHLMREEWIELGLADSLTMIASDGMPYAPGAHPRSAGTFSRVLGRYVRERAILSLPEAIRKMTLMPAQRLEAALLAAKTKGRLQPGMDADITVFDPATVRDEATFEGGLAFSTGIEYVIVNGTVVVERGETVAGVFPGRAVVGMSDR